MEEHGNQNCPLCGKPASFIFKDYQSHKLFVCDKCKAFIIPEMEEDFIQSIDRSLKTQYSNISCQLPDDMLLQISVVRDGNNVKVFHDAVRRTNFLKDKIYRVPTVQIPQIIGTAADLMFVKSEPIAYLIDCLTLYETVVIPADTFSISSIYSHCEPGELDILFSSGRIKYTPARTCGIRKWDSNKPPAENILDCTLPHMMDDDRYTDLRKHVRENTIYKGDQDYSYWEKIRKEATDAFVSTSKRIGYEWLFPMDRFGMPSRDLIVGLETGIARINDLLTNGIDAIDLDLELATYLEICFPCKQLDEIMEGNKEVIRTDLTLAEQLPRIENLPPLGEMVRKGQLSIKDAIAIVNGEEAAKLRKWLADNISPGLDVRDVYFQKLNELPSKKAWTGWIRFGLVSGVSTLISSLLTANPVIGIGLGLLTGAADQKLGEKTTSKIIDNYHARQWLSYISKKAF